MDKSLLLDNNRAEKIASVVISNFVEEYNKSVEELENSEDLKLKIEEVKETDSSLAVMIKSAEVLRSLPEDYSINIDYKISELAKVLAKIELNVPHTICYWSISDIKNELIAKLLLTTYSSYEDTYKMAYDFVSSRFKPTYYSLENDL